MSLILEALRKSEAERQRGRAPGLFVEQQPARRRGQRAAQRWPWALGALLGALLLAWGWREWTRGTASETAATPAASAAPAADAVAAPTERPPPTTTAAPAAPAARAAAPAPEPIAAKRPAGPPQAAAPAPEATSATAPQEPALPTVASLAAGERAQLPPLKLSMHVYAAEPAQRFVILDGQRLDEGASPAPGLVLEQIRRDGLVLLVNGRRVLLARP